MEGMIMSMSASLAEKCKISNFKYKSLNDLNAQFIYDLYCAVCVPAMEYDPVLPQFAVPSVLLTSIIECISENFISFDLQEIFTANDLLSHKAQAWFAVLKLFDREAVAKVEIPSAKDDKDLQVPKKIAPSRTAPKPRSVIYSPRLQYLRQKRMRDYRRKNVAALKSDKHRLLSDLKAIPELSICKKLLLDSAVKRRHYLNSLKRARISCQNIQWRQRHLKAQVVRMKANLENKLHKKQLLINDFKDKISRKLLNEMDLIEEKDFTI
ncbi:Elongation factor [Trichinella spiralis]|uniref:Elongation factor n=1 Tax=Trichinella spiralis TaxID=6334 RepID=A0ABR3KGB0_TRISP